MWVRHCNSKKRKNFENLRCMRDNENGIFNEIDRFLRMIEECRDIPNTIKRG